MGYVQVDVGPNGSEGLDRGYVARRRQDARGRHKYIQRAHNNK